MKRRENSHKDLGQKNSSSISLNLKKKKIETLQMKFNFDLRMIHCLVY